MVGQAERFPIVGASSAASGTPSRFRSRDLRGRRDRGRRLARATAVADVGTSAGEGAQGRELAKAGISPSVAWRTEPEATPTFKQAAEEFHAQVARGWRNGKHGAQWLNTLKSYAYPVIGSMPVDQIGAREIQRLLMPIWLSKGETARGFGSVSASFSITRTAKDGAMRKRRCAR